MIGLVSPAVAWNVYEVCPSDIYLGKEEKEKKEIPIKIKLAFENAFA